MKHLEKKIKRLLTVAILLTVSNINPIFAQNDAKLVYYGSDSIGHNFDPMDSVEVSLLTCSPHEEIYSLYGHAAIRWHSGDQDLVFNWGMFSFNKPYFVLRFVFGITDYELGAYPYDSFWPYYQKWGSSITEQVLNLTNDEKRRLQLALAENVANFPIPIITGIGHDRDESILDMVSHQRVKTPTAAAAFLIDHAQTVLDSLGDAQNRISRHALQKLSTFHNQLSTIQETLPRLFSVVRTRQEARLDQLYSHIAHYVQQKLISRQSSIVSLQERIPMLLDRRLQTESHRLELLSEKLKVLDPALLLKRGYSITLKDGVAIRDPKTLNPGDQIETRLDKGTIKSTVI